ncbi:RagB/SusD family nutrient uptake outer membrane protein [Catalinimonas sp. 4WD22]|uniref:RagB/SusD family nutrient uptake outer membrane protein n=1 Tax=Catalinimonas locisalis TaxID=3133978 RepID=UPI003100D958
MKNILTKGLMCMTIMLGLSCTDLDTELYSELTPDDFFQTDDQFVAALGTAYTSLYAYAGDPWSVQELSTATSAAPAKFGPWDDGGIWARLHRHEWEITFGAFNASWNMGFGGISTCNRLIEQLQDLAPPEQAERFVAELRALRAYYYFLMIDMFGDVPFITSFSDAEPNPTRTARAEVFGFLVDELNEVIQVLPEEVSTATYGRMNKWAAMALLTKLYLNAEVYTGTPEWELAASTAQEIIDGGQFSLEVNYFDNFAVQNSGSSENIFVIPYEAGNANGFSLHMRTLHPLNARTYNFSTGPWNGYTALEEFYNSFEDEDVRKDMFIVGQQYSATGEPLLDPNGAIEVDSEGNMDPSGPPIVFTPYINELTPFAFSDAGARIGKFEFERGIQLDMDNDFPLLRYGDILLMRAEALWRLNPSSAEAVELVRQVRERSELGPIDPLTEDALFEEIQREVAFEGHSRTNMIRFDRFNAPWWEKDASDPNKNLFPIPAAQLNGNPNLVQNPGY